MTQGQAHTVKYQYLITMLLSEAQEQCRHAESEPKLTIAQQQKIEELEQRLSQFERMLGNNVQAWAPE